MSKFIALMFLSLSFQAMAGVELHAKLLRDHCTIKDGHVTRTFVISDDGALNFTTSRAVNLQGLEKFARVAVTQITDGPNLDPNFKYEVRLNGESYEIKQDDSKEALNLIQLIVKACK